jgi:hypothetical protein
MYDPQRGSTKIEIDRTSKITTPAGLSNEQDKEQGKNQRKI